MVLVSANSKVNIQQHCIQNVYVPAHVVLSPIEYWHINLSVNQQTD